MAKKKVLIAGALGLTGRAAVRHFESKGWEVVGLSRRTPDQAYRDLGGKTTTYIAVDLRDPADCEAKLSTLTDVTHVVYAAVYETSDLKAGWVGGAEDFVGINVKMLGNFLDVMLKTAPGLQHMTVFQGAKAYGAHTGAMKLPAKESDPRLISVGFYTPQEELVKARQKGKSWTWTIVRPQMISGFATGAPISCLPGVGVYAAVCRELGLPLRFTGRADGPLEAVDVDLLAKVLEWAATSPRAANEIYNVGNGDCFCWTHVYPRIAREVFDMDIAPPHTDYLSVVMADKADIWDDIVQRYGLQKYAMRDLVASWQIVDFFLDYGDRNRLSILSTIKLRKHGFHECEDSEDMIVRQLKDMQAAKVLPPRAR
ncbi:MAG: dependent epimerase/dehydratase family protein [Panacagrimonas sp.]|jgi:nucleoside-diphosphate-sugar epimerase|nr:SDR family oxidoreductase [Panacagrimonas sp.]MCC2657721.1 dependent epimerase/dehydratase family protein [Panacagrimonas sp.]